MAGTLRSSWLPFTGVPSTTSSFGVLMAWMAPAMEASSRVRAARKATSSACEPFSPKTLNP